MVCGRRSRIFAWACARRTAPQHTNTHNRMERRLKLHCERDADLRVLPLHSVDLRGQHRCLRSMLGSAGTSGVPQCTERRTQVLGPQGIPRDTSRTGMPGPSATNHEKGLVECGAPVRMLWRVHSCAHAHLMCACACACARTITVVEALPVIFKGNGEIPTASDKTDRTFATHTKER